LNGKTVWGENQCEIIIVKDFKQDWISFFIIQEGNFNAGIEKNAEEKE
jgi:hypothetical protein